MAKVSKGLRFRVLERDGFRCRYCGRGRESGVLLHVDHVVAQSRGGSNHPNNLVTACESCNVGKGADVIQPDPSGYATHEARRAHDAEMRCARVLGAWLMSMFGAQELASVTPADLIDVAALAPHDLIAAVRDTLAWAARERGGPRIPAVWYFLDVARSCAEHPALRSA